MEDGASTTYWSRLVRIRIRHVPGTSRLSCTSMTYIINGCTRLNAQTRDTRPHSVLLFEVGSPVHLVKVRSLACERR